MELIFKRLALDILLLFVFGCAGVQAQSHDGWQGHRERGKASYYAAKFHGRKTASGERFDQNAKTAAHRKLPFGTKVQVTNLQNGKSVVVRINDRGPFVKGRVIDLSKAAFSSIGNLRAGVIEVAIEVVR